MSGPQEVSEPCFACPAEIVSHHTVFSYLLLDVRHRIYDMLARNLVVKSTKMPGLRSSLCCCVSQNCNFNKLNQDWAANESENLMTGRSSLL